MAELLVVGGGFAGVWAAAAAAHVREKATANLAITLVSSSPDMVMRPRLYEPNPDAMRVPVSRILEPIGVSLEIATAHHIDAGNRRVEAVDAHGRHKTYKYDRLVLASGSHLKRPQVAWANRLFDVDSIDGASRLDAHLRALSYRADSSSALTAVVVGSGFTGLEVATELARRFADRPAGGRVVLVESAPVVAPELGEAPRPAITQALQDLQIEARLSTSVESVEEDHVVLASGEVIHTKTVIWAAGMRASSLTRDVQADVDDHGRLIVDEFLRVPAARDIFAAGDTACAPTPDGHRTLQSCQHATPLGRHAGHNAAADLVGWPLERFAPSEYVTCLDLGAAGAIFTLGWDRTVCAVGDTGKKLKRKINETWIYPPLDDPDAILSRAGRLSPPNPSL